MAELDDIRLEDVFDIGFLQKFQDIFARAVDSGRSNIINVQIAPSMGKESGHIGNLNPKLNLQPLEENERSHHND